MADRDLHISRVTRKLSEGGRVVVTTTSPPRDSAGQIIAGPPVVGLHIRQGEGPPLGPEVASLLSQGWTIGASDLLLRAPDAVASAEVELAVEPVPVVALAEVPSVV